MASANFVAKTKKATADQVNVFSTRTVDEADDDESSIHMDVDHKNSHYVENDHVTYATTSTRMGLPVLLDPTS